MIALKKKSLIKTSDIKSLIKKETKELDDYTESNNKKLFNSPQLEEVSSLSLASLSFKNSTEEIQEEKLDNLPSDNFTENDFQIVWKKFCDIEKNKGNNNILSLLNMNNPSINDNIITISTINKMNFKEVKGYKSRIQTFLSKELNNYSISVDVKLSEEITKSSYLDSKDKLDLLIKDNENIGKLITELKLRI